MAFVTTATAQQKPNILLILTDDMGYGDMGCADHPYVKTPNIDRLAREGTTFTDFYVNSGVCAPSRVAFLSGQFPARQNVHAIYSGAEVNRERGVPDFLDTTVLTVADVLSGAGYVTEHIGKWHICGRAGGPPPGEYGFESWLVSNPTHLTSPVYKERKENSQHYVSDSSRWMVDDAIDAMKRNRGSEKPFFINLCFLAPHSPLQPTDDEMAVYEGLKADSNDFPSWMKDYAADAKDLTAQMQTYCATMTGMDRQVGRLLDYLDESELAQNTLVMFTSDNGPEDYHIGNSRNAGVGSPGKFRGRKRSPYLGGMRVPCIVRWPGVTPAGEENPAVWSGVDFLPTMAAVAGAALPVDLTIDGENCIDVMKGKTIGRKNPLFWEWKFEVQGNQDYTSPQVCMLDGSWWAGWQPDGSRVELFDISTDPEQRTNLKDEYPEVSAEMVQQLSDWKAEIPEAYTPPSETSHAETSHAEARAGTQAPRDIVIYGGTCAAVIAAVQAKQMGKSVVIVSPDTILGGLSSGGLGWTDTGNKSVIGGLSRDFYHRIYKQYQKPENWKWQEKSEYGAKGQGTPAMDRAQKTMWIFEPSIARAVFEEYIEEFNIEVHRDEWLDRKNGVEMKDGKIVSITTLSGKTYPGKIFMDTTYEGDLIATAGIDYHVGRESNAEFGETWNGVQAGVDHHSHHFQKVGRPISPYVDPNDPTSGVLPRISTESPGVGGEGDHRVQAYCFRMCLTNHPENRIPFSEPEGYDPYQYELLGRIYEAGWKETFNKFDPLPNHKTDTNNHGPFSTDNIGYNYDYPEASYERRREIIEEHETYQKGWLYFHCTDPRVPKEIQENMKTWGLPKDEFTENGNWSHQLYIREARRMRGAFVMTENELRKVKPTPDSVGMGSYAIDSHNVQRHIDENGHVQNEGDIGVSTRGPYQIAYGSMIPRKEQCQNLLVPVCVSSTHIAFGSIRMEPVFMILGQSSAAAASIAIDDDLAVQDVPYSELRKQLLKDGQVLEYDGTVGSGKGKSVSDIGGIVVDDENAELTGIWKESSTNGPFVGFGYRHDDNKDKGKKSATFTTKLEKGGEYSIRISYPTNNNRASNVSVTIKLPEGDQTILVNQKNKPEHKPFHDLGTFHFDAGATSTVTISNEATSGHVIIDSVQWLQAE
ncbi:MAG: FAD-dependent oxidoreductase [Verrucomicrobiales bacterium]